MPTLLDQILSGQNPNRQSLTGFWSRVPTNSQQGIGSNNLGFGSTNFGNIGGNIGFGGGLPSGNPSARSFGVNPFGGGVPDLSKADPSVLKRLDISDLTYSVPGGGYISSKDALNANSFYNKFGGSDQSANRRAAAYYAYLATLPTRPIGTPALNLLGGGSPGPPLGAWSGPFQVQPSRFTSTPLSGGGAPY
jgi:hypothetical protein